MPDNSRFAEIVTELMGAQHAAALIKQVLDAASPEVKADLADKILKMAAESNGAVYDASRYLQQLIERRAKEIFVAEFQARVDAEVRARIEERLANLVQRETDDALFHVAQGVSEYCTRLMAAAKGK